MTRKAGYESGVQKRGPKAGYKSGVQKRGTKAGYKSARVSQVTRVSDQADRALQHVFLLLYSCDVPTLLTLSSYA
eukprot:6206561-Pleurochrysis_carterae.AAC.1